MEAEDAERERQQQTFEQRQKEALRDAGHGADELVLGDRRPQAVGVDEVDEVEALDAVAVPNVDVVHAWTVSTRTCPGRPSGSGAWRRPMATVAGCVFVHTVRFARYVAEPRRL